MRKLIKIAVWTINAALVFAFAFYLTQARAYDTSEQMDLQPQLECIATNIYHEARNQSELGMRAVAWVTLNRVQHELYPNDACGVVYDAVRDENGKPKKHKCQFSWYCDGKSDKIQNAEKWAQALLVASDVLHNYAQYPDPTGGSHMYHATYVNPYWVSDYVKVVKIDAHIFYKD